MHPVKEIENTNATDVIIDICQFGDTLFASFFPFILTSNALSKGTPRLKPLSINFVLFCWFCNGKPARWKLRILCLGYLANLEFH